MKIAFSTLACPDWSWRDILENGSRSGYDGVEIRLIERDPDLLARPEFQPREISRRKSDLENCGMRICGFGSSVRFDHPDEATLKRECQTGKAYLELAREFDADFVRVFGDTLPSPEQPDARKRTFNNIVAGLQELGEHAGRLGVAVLIETHGDFSDSRLTAELLHSVQHPAVGVLWDTHHPWCFHEESLGETYERLREWIGHTHWKDSVSTPRSESPTSTLSDEAAQQAHSLMSGHRHADYVLFGGGRFPAEDCLRLLQQSDYNGWFSYEWEKMWHPEIEPPEVALPLFPSKLRRLAEIVDATRPATGTANGAASSSNTDDRT